jgi:flagellar hook-basal body complex protein FliE
MSIDPISLATQLAQPAAAPTGTEKTQPDFGAWLSQQIASVNQSVTDADTQVRHLAAGDATNLHQVMISLEKAKLSFEMALQVRNKLLDAYQEIMRMQI